MIKKQITSLALIIAVLILEIIPYGAVCRFMGDPKTGTVLRYTYSYFDLTPFGYANFGPFLTAVLSCILTILIVINSNKIKLSKPIAIISTIAVATSLMPLFFGLSYYSVLGGLITLLLAIITVIHFKIKS